MPSLRNWEAMLPLAVEALTFSVLLSRARHPLQIYDLTQFYVSTYFELHRHIDISAPYFQYYSRPGVFYFLSSLVALHIDFRGFHRDLLDPVFLSCLFSRLFTEIERSLLLLAESGIYL